MSAHLPDWCYGATICRYEGHDYGTGGACINCGQRLRCVCGAFVRVDGFDAHLETCRVARTIPDA